MGHEFIGVVEETGKDVSTLRRATSSSPRSRGPTAPATSAARACRPPAATAGSGPGGIDGAQAEAVRVPQADGTLVKVRSVRTRALLPSLLTLSDVYGTGYHAAVKAASTRGPRSR